MTESLPTYHERVPELLLRRLAKPGDEFGHQPGRVEWRRGLEHDADLLAVLVERYDVVLCAAGWLASSQACK